MKVNLYLYIKGGIHISHDHNLLYAMLFWTFCVCRPYLYPSNVLFIIIIENFKQIKPNQEKSNF